MFSVPDPVLRVIVGKLVLQLTKNAASNNCSTIAKCDECAKSPACAWTFARQRCADTDGRGEDDGGGGGPIVRSQWACPEFTPALVDVETGDGRRRYAVIVTVSRGSTAVMAHLRNSAIACTVDGAVRTGAMTADGAIECEPDRRAAERSPAAYYYGRTNALHVVRFDVFVGGVPLVFDDPVLHYVSAYEYPCDDQRCVVGTWDEGDGPARRHHYCRWCARNRGCAVQVQQSKCAAWPAGGGGGDNGSAAIDLTGGRVPVRTEAARVLSFRPEYAVATADAVVTVTVRGHSVLADGRAVAVTVVGRPCVLAAGDGPGPAEDDGPWPTDDDGDGEAVLECVVAAAKPSEWREDRVYAGPLEVTYSSAGTEYVLRSAATFRFVWPEIKSLVPKCGPAGGPTALTVLGERLDVTAGNGSLRVTAGGADCPVVEHGPERIVCVTDGAAAPGVVPVWVDFGNGLATGVSRLSFEYAATPYADDDQELAAIASGGTAMVIRGEFACVHRATMAAVVDDAIVYESCRVPDAAAGAAAADRVTCRTPRVHPGPDGRPVDVPFWLHVQVGGVEHKLPGSRYRAYPDPEFAGYDVTGRTVIVRDARMGLGYGAADLNVTARHNGTAVPCAVVSADGGRIECVLPYAPAADAAELGLTVAVGSHRARPVGRWTEASGAQWAAAGAGAGANRVTGHRLRVAVVLSGVSVVSVFVALVFGLLFCYRIMLANSKRQTEKRYLEELRNITAAADNRKPF